MILNIYQHAHDFLLKTQTTLEKDEVANSLLLGICLRLRNFPERIKIAPYLAVVEDEQDIVVAACMTPPYNLVLSTATSGVSGALELLVRDLLDSHWPVPGVLGPAHLANEFALTWNRLTEQTYQEGVRERLFKLHQVIPPRPVPGRLRVATSADLERVTHWALAFNEEALHKADTAEAEEAARNKIADQDMYVWELPGSQVVSMAAKGRPVTHVISIGFVYTPPEYRGNGYASNCVATLSQLLLDSGWQYCSLFTDLSNPTSNSIYQKMGYRPVCDFNEYLFVG